MELPNGRLDRETVLSWARACEAAGTAPERLVEDLEAMTGDDLDQFVEGYRLGFERGSGPASN